MLDYLSENWVTIVLVAGFVWLHLRMHRGHGGHGRSSDGTHHQPQPDRPEPTEIPPHDEEPHDHRHQRLTAARTAARGPTDARPR
ncbi:hypothetical protein [Euzebya sp.]|uniref:hypothetical protein n=1 Tax=Euzebya sp. TaxID=1971409 RepID=UPI003511D28F